MKLKTFIQASITILLLSFCQPARGEFGFAVTNDEGKDILEKEISQVTDYKMMRTGVIFSPDDTIHYVYKFKWNLFDYNYSSRDEFYVVLEKESLGFVEIELKKKFIEKDSYSLKDKFQNLDVGRYNLKVAYEGDVIDSIIFEVIPEEGYKVTDDTGVEPDEIIRYSK